MDDDKKYISFGGLKTVLTKLKSRLHKIAFSGSYSDLSDAPSIPKKVSDLDDGMNYLDKTSKSKNIIEGPIKVDVPPISGGGAIQVGDFATGSNNAFLHVRNLDGKSITGYNIVGMCCAVNFDGTATFQYKKYDNDKGSNPKNMAVFRFSNKGVQFAVNTGSGNSPDESMYKKVLLEDDLGDFAKATDSDWTEIFAD